MDPSSIGWIGGIGGTLLGVLGGAIGTYYSIRNTAGPRERAFVIRMAASISLLVTAFLLALWWTPGPYRYWLWVPYPLALVAIILLANRRQGAIRRQEASEVGPM